MAVITQRDQERSSAVIRGAGLAGASLRHSDSDRLSEHSVRRPLLERDHDGGLAIARDCKLASLARSRGTGREPNGGERL